MWQIELRRLGGGASKRQLVDAGASGRALSAAVASGALLRPRNGRYAAPDAGDLILAALRAGGRLSCVSAARSYGLWGGKDGRLHLLVPPHAGRVEQNEDDVVHWRRTEPHEEVWRSSPGDCLRSVVRCADQETAVAVLDTALSAGLVTLGGLRRVFAWEPERSRWIVSLARPGSDSGVESILRQRLSSRGHVVEQQLAVPGVGRVDLRVDGLVYVEVDGFQFHSGREAFKRDRLRDAAMALQGARWLRVAARHVLDHPESVVATIEAVLQREELRGVAGA